MPKDFQISNQKKLPQLSEIAAVILCGGLGTRLRSVVANRPKILAAFGDRTLFDILFKYLKRLGLEKIVLSTGYLGEQIKAHCVKNNISDIVFSSELKPLDTGGAFKKALSLVKSRQILVINGDTLCAIDYQDFLNFHLKKKAFVSMVLAPRHREDSGGVKTNSNGLIIGFNERENLSKSPFMSAGIYIFEKEVVNLLPMKEKFSLEREVFPFLIRKRQCYGYFTDKEVIDIGTPERYQAARQRLI